MALKIPVPGIDQFLDDIPEGTLNLFQGDNEGTQSFFAQLIGHAAYKNGREVTYITSRFIQDVVSEVRRIEPDRIPFYIVENVPLEDWRIFISSKSLLIVDSFSYLVNDLETSALRASLTEFRKIVKEMGTTVILVSHRLVGSPEKAAIAAYLADSVVDLEYQEEDEFIRRYIRVHRWHGRILEQFIYYKIEQGRMDIDLRARVV